MKLCASSTSASNFSISEAVKPRRVSVRTLPSSSAAYARSDMMEKRRRLAAAWAAYCGGERGRVVSIAG